MLDRSGRTARGGNEVVVWSVVPRVEVEVTANGGVGRQGHCRAR